MNESMPQGETGGAASQQEQKQEPRQEQRPPQAGATGSAGDMKKDAMGLIAQLEAMLDEYMVKKAPFALPLGLKEFIVKVSPYLIIIFAILSLPVILMALGYSTVLPPAMMMDGYGYGYGFGRGPGVMISLVTAVIVLVMEVLAVSGLFKRTKSAWRLVFYATIVSLIGSLFALNIIGGILSAIISWYILFQVKDMYKN